MMLAIAGRTKPAVMGFARKIATLISPRSTGSRMDGIDTQSREGWSSMGAVLKG